MPNNSQFKTDCKQDSNDEDIEDDEENYDAFSENVINPKDITDISNSLSHDIDSICVSNVRTADDIREVRRHCSSKVAKVIAKIQTLEGYHILFQLSIKFIYCND